MSTEEKIRIVEAVVKSGKVSISQFILEYNGSTIIKQSEEEKEKNTEAPKLSPEQKANAILAVQKYFWGNSSYAVVFGVLRDCYGYPDNRSQYEREVEMLPYDRERNYVCTLGIVSSTFNDNPYMKLHVERWEQNGAKERVLLLVEKFKDAVNYELQLEKPPEKLP